MVPNRDKDDDRKQKDSGSSQQTGSGSSRGFASMDEDKQREIASKGGKASHEKGTAHEFTSEEAREAGKAAHEKGTAHEFTSKEAREAGRKGGESSPGGHGQSGSHEKDSSSSTRGGTHEQHVKAGSQSHKNK